MSHLKERSEKICLNCNALLSGHFCHACGQENIEPKETVWHLITHFFNDITHFDGKFFDTLGILIRKPGFLPRQYMMGKRASYLNPIRMYIFTSAIFFFVFFSLFHLDEKNINSSMRLDMNGKTLDDLRALDSVSLKQFTTKNNNGKPIPRERLEKFFDSVKNDLSMDLTGEGIKTKRQYDSIVKKSPGNLNWLHRKLLYREIEINEKYHNSVGAYLTSLFNTFMHYFPQLMFISLPIFALFLTLLYRRHKEYYYVSHGIFGIDFYIFVFICLFLILCVKELRDLLHWRWLTFFGNLLYLPIFFYLYKAMRNFYHQRRAKTLFKFILLNICSVIMMLFLFAVFMLFSFLKI